MGVLRVTGFEGHQEDLHEVGVLSDVDILVLIDVDEVEDVLALAQRQPHGREHLVELSLVHGEIIVVQELLLHGVEVVGSPGLLQFGGLLGLGPLDSRLGETPQSQIAENQKGVLHGGLLITISMGYNHNPL